jgi:predicted AlkP superfamily pyrophosphatase or phosphodiesterase
VVSEYGHCDVSRPVLINRLLRQSGFLTVRPGPFGEVLETFQSRGFAVCDHQVAHVYVPDPADRPIVRDFLASQPGIARVLVDEERTDWGLDHPRSGELVALAEPDAWFAYPYWLDDRHAPDFAPTVDIHRKPGYDPVELFLDPHIRLPTLKIGWKLLQSRLGLRTLLDVIPLDATLVRGSHGRINAERDDCPLLITSAAQLLTGTHIAATDVCQLLLRHLTANPIKS